MTELEKHLLKPWSKHRHSNSRGKPIYSRCSRVPSKTIRASGSIQEAFREYQRNRPDPKRELEQISSASQQLELSSARLQDTKQSLDRAITGIRNASQQVKEINEPKRSYGMNFGR